MSEEKVGGCKQTPVKREICTGVGGVTHRGNRGSWYVAGWRRRERQVAGAGEGHRIEQAGEREAYMLRVVGVGKSSEFGVTRPNCRNSCRRLLGNLLLTPLELSTDAAPSLTSTQGPTSNTKS